jgi:hypothetical protein
MKREDENIDELIKQALSEEESDILDRLGEQNVLEQWLGIYKGRAKWLNIYVTVMTLIFVVLTIFSLIEFLNASEIRQMLLWGAGTGVGLLVITMLKLYAWMQMDKNVLLREIKRLELQIVSLKKNNS